MPVLDGIITGIVFDPDALYTEEDLVRLPMFNSNLLERERRSGALRFTRKGVGRGSTYLYFGDWLITWLRQAPLSEESEARS